MNKQHPDYLLLKQLLEVEKQNKKIEELGDREYVPKIKTFSDALDQYYFLNKLRNYCSYLSQVNMVHPRKLGFGKEDLRLIDEILAAVQQMNTVHPSISAYHQLSELLSLHIQPEALAISVTDLLDLQGYLTARQDHIHPSDQVYILSLLSNICIKQINLNRPRFRKHFILINNSFLNIKFGQTGKRPKIPSSIFKNIVTVALLIHDDVFFQNLQTRWFSSYTAEQHPKTGLEWTERFVEEYGPLLDRKDRVYKRYCAAYVAYVQKDFEKAYRQLGKVKGIRGIHINIASKMLYLKIIYELNTTDSKLLRREDVKIPRILDAYRKMIEDDLNRKKELTYSLDIYKEFANGYRKLYRFQFEYRGQLYNEKNPQFLTRKRDLEKEFRSYQSTAQNWLLEKLKEIK